jgi:hypothetical protein
MPKFGFSGKVKGDVDGDVVINAKTKVPNPKVILMLIKAPKMPKFGFGI